MMTWPLSVSLFHLTSYPPPLLTLFLSYWLSYCLLTSYVSTQMSFLQGDLLHHPAQVSLPQPITLFSLLSFTVFINTLHHLIQYLEIVLVTCLLSG